MNSKMYTAERRENNQVLVHMPGMGYILTIVEASRLRDSLIAALIPEKRMECPMWILELGYIATAKAPLFSGLLLKENGELRWTKDAELSEFVRRGWVEIVDDGFVITEHGKRAYEREWAEYQKHIRRR